MLNADFHPDDFTWWVLASLAFHTSGLLSSSALPSETTKFRLYLSELFSDLLFSGCLIKAVILKQ